MSSFQFSKIVIVESLDDSEFLSGTELATYLSTVVDDPNEPPGVELAKLSSATQFKGLIDLLTFEAQAGERPILHIETHGWEDASGIVFSDGSDISWDALRETLAPLNVASDFNLVVSAAACFGGHFVEELRPGQIAPCMMVVGPTHTTDGPELLGRFRDFYRVLIHSLDVPEAIKALNSSSLSEGGFLTVLAESWFETVLVGYIEKGCTRPELERRGRGVFSAMKAEGKSISLDQVMQIGRARVHGLLDDYAARFFAFHVLPGNRERYREVLNKARDRIAKFIASQGY